MVFLKLGLGFSEQAVGFYFSAVTPYGLTVFVDNEGRHGFHAFLVGERRIMVDIQLEHGHTAVEQFLDLFNYRHHFLAVRTPSGIKFHENYFA